MLCKQILLFLKVYDRSISSPRDLLEFFDTDGSCIMNAEEVLQRTDGDVLRAAYDLLMQVPPDVKLTYEKFKERVKPYFDPSDPLRTAKRIVRYHPLPDGNKRAALVLYILLYWLNNEYFPPCKHLKKILEEYLRETGALA